MRYRQRWCSVAVLIASGAVLVSCTQAAEDTATHAGAVTVPPALTFNAAEPGSRATALAYARSARFVTDSRLVDEQTLRLPGGTTTRARIEATVYAHLLPDSQLARGALIARFVSDGEFAPLGLNRGVQYLFVDSVAGAGRRAIIMDDDSTRAPTVMPVVLADTPHDFSVPSARWIESGAFSYPNPSCGRYCCIPCDDTRGYICPTGTWPPRLDMEEMLRTRVIRPGPIPR